jgi:hypothetical protein
VVAERTADDRGGDCVPSTASSHVERYHEHGE